MDIPAGFEQYIDENSAAVDASADRLAAETVRAIQDGTDLSELRSQGFLDDLVGHFQAALEIVHEFLCTETPRFKEARMAFSGLVDAGITACASALVAAYPALAGGKGLIIAAFKVAWGVGVSAFCRAT